MNETYEAIDLTAVLPELERFARDTAVDERQLEGARALLLRLDSLRTTAESSSRGWQAVRASAADGVRTITCWNDDRAEELILSATWRGSALESWIASSRGRYRASQPADGDVRPAADLRQRAREEFDRWITAHPRQRWRCATCGFENAAEAKSCLMCGRAAGAPASASFGRPRPVTPAVAAAPEQTEMNLPAGFDAFLLPGLVRDIAASQPAAASSFQVIIAAIPPQNRQAVVDMLRQIISAKAELLIETLPATVATTSSLTKATKIRDRLRAAGANADIRKEKKES